MESVKLVKANDCIVDEIQLADQEPISNTSFNQILQENDGNLIIARV